MIINIIMRLAVEVAQKLRGRNLTIKRNVKKRSLSIARAKEDKAPRFSEFVGTGPLGQERGANSSMDLMNVYQKYTIITHS
jgi:hypothetical protein